MSKVGELAIEIEKEEIAFNHSLYDVEERMDFKRILIWLKVNNIAYVQYQDFLTRKESIREIDKKYYDFISGKFYTKQELINIAKENGFKKKSNKLLNKMLKKFPEGGSVYLDDYTAEEIIKAKQDYYEITKEKNKK